MTTTTTIKQWVYAYTCWARKKNAGDSRTRGFQTYNWTDGLSLGEIEELERRCANYEPPRNLPSRPTQEELGTLFPRAFYSFTLASGKKVIAQTSYVGEGFHDHRWGAILSHAFILESGDWPLRVMDYCDSPLFWRKLPQDIETRALSYKDRQDCPDPDFLPALDAASFAKKESCGPYTGEAVARHFDSADKRKEPARLLQRASTAGAGAATLQLCKPRPEVEWLFAGLGMALPRQLTNNITLATWLTSTMVPQQDRGRWYALAGVRDEPVAVPPAPEPADALVSLFDAALGKPREFEQFSANFRIAGIAEAQQVAALFLLMQQERLDRPPLGLEQSITFLSASGNERARADFAAWLGRVTLGNRVLSTNDIPLLFRYVGDKKAAASWFFKRLSAFKDDATAVFHAVRQLVPEAASIWLVEFASTAPAVTSSLLADEVSFLNAIDAARKYSPSSVSEANLLKQAARFEIKPANLGRWTALAESTSDANQKQVFIVEITNRLPVPAIKDDIYLAGLAKLAGVAGGADAQLRIGFFRALLRLAAANTPEERTTAFAEMEHHVDAFKTLPEHTQRQVIEMNLDALFASAPDAKGYASVLNLALGAMPVTVLIERCIRLIQQDVARQKHMILSDAWLHCMEAALAGLNDKGKQSLRDTLLRRLAESFLTGYTPAELAKLKQRIVPFARLDADGEKNWSRLVETAPKRQEPPPLNKPLPPPVKPQFGAFGENPAPNADNDDKQDQPKRKFFGLF